jgi:hypothetical protein
MHVFVVVVAQLLSGCAAASAAHVIRQLTLFHCVSAIAR